MDSYRFSIITFTSVMAFMLSAKEIQVALPQIAFAGLLLMPSFIILMCLAQVESSFITIVRTGTYLLVFYEQHELSVSWQHRIQQLREKYPKSRSLGKSLWYGFLPLFLSSLVSSLVKLFLITGVFDGGGGAAIFDVSPEGQGASWESGIVVMFAIYTPMYAALFVMFLVIMKDLLYIWGTPYFEEMSIGGSSCKKQRLTRISRSGLLRTDDQLCSGLSGCGKRARF